VIDCFALLGAERRPWLDPGALKETYHRLTTAHHPDVPGATADFAAINRAYQTLCDPAARLRHLLELESPASLSRAQPVPGDIAQYFTPVAETRQSVDLFLKKQSAATSPLAKALLSTEQYEVQERLDQTIATLSEKQESLFSRLREADALWLADRRAALALLPVLWQSLGYTAKWLATLRESLFTLATL
jgi:curved DNA-binding protein CbpA